MGPADHFIAAHVDPLRRRIAALTAERDALAAELAKMRDDDESAGRELERLELDMLDVHDAVCDALGRDCVDGGVAINAKGITDGVKTLGGYVSTLLEAIAAHRAHPLYGTSPIPADQALHEVAERIRKAIGYTGGQG